MHRRSFLHTIIGKSGSGPARPASPIRLANNENPYGPGPAALDALRWAAARAHRYPGGLRDALVETIARVHDVPEDHILLSGGSGDVMRAAVYTYTSSSRPFITPRPTYEAPMRSAQHIGSPVIRVPLTASLGHDVQAIAARSQGAGLAYVCNPNNPTATAVPAAELARMITAVARRSPSTRVFVDEAYFDYADRPGVESMIPHALHHPQLIVTRTFSKIHGMAGMRVAYAIAKPSTLAELATRHSASSLGAASLAAAAAALDDAEYRHEMALRNRSVRALVVQEFEQAGFHVATADANFAFVHVRRDARTFAEECLTRGVQIGRAFPPLGQWARIAIGTADEMRIAMRVFKEVLARQNRRLAS